MATLKYGIRTADETYLRRRVLRVRERPAAVQRAEGEVRMRRPAARAHGVERRLLLQRGQRVLERLPRRGRRRRAPTHARGYGIQDVARAFGFGAPTGISLGGDQSGRIPDLAFRQELQQEQRRPDVATWRRGDSANLAVGQGDVLVTPLQLADGYAAFANGGTLHSPQLVAGIHASSAGQPEGEVGKLLAVVDVPAPRDTGLTPEVRDPVLAGLDGVVNSREGTAFFSFNNYEGVPRSRGRPAPRRRAARTSRTRRGSPGSPTRRTIPRFRSTWSSRWWSRVGSAPTPPLRSSAA